MSSSSSAITLSKALRTRKTLKGQINDLTSRAIGCAAWVTDAPRDFVFADVNQERKNKIEALIVLETAIARANSMHSVSTEERQMTLAELIRRQAEVRGEITFLESLPLRNGTVRVATGEYDEHRRPTFQNQTWMSAYTEATRVAQLQVLRKLCEELNETLETANHAVLVELPASWKP